MAASVSIALAGAAWSGCGDDEGEATEVVNDVTETGAQSAEDAQQQGDQATEDAQQQAEDSTGGTDY